MGAMDPPTPVLVGMLVCDTAIQDVTSNKYTLVGVFSEINVQTFPAYHRSAWLYAQLIGCEGEYGVKIEFVRVSDQQVFVSGESEIVGDNRHTNVERAWQLPPLPLEAPGEYEFRLWMNDRFISNVRIKVRQA